MYVPVVLNNIILKITENKLYISTILIAIIWYSRDNII